jgi:hypothetical protein
MKLNFFNSALVTDFIKEYIPTEAAIMAVAVKVTEK